MRIWMLLRTAAVNFAQARPASNLRIYVIDVEGGGATLVVSLAGLASGKEHNTSDDMIANVEASPECKGHAIGVDARPDGSFVATNTGNNFSQTYRVR